MTATFHCLKVLLPVGVSSVFAHRVAAHFCLRASPAGRRCRGGVQAEPSFVGVGLQRRRWRDGRLRAHRPWESLVQLYYDEDDR